MLLALAELALVVDSEPAFLKQIVDEVVTVYRERVRHAEDRGAAWGALHLGDRESVRRDAQVLGKGDAGVKLGRLDPSGPKERQLLHGHFVLVCLEVERAQVPKVDSSGRIDCRPLRLREHHKVAPVVAGGSDGGGERVDPKLHHERLEDLAREHVTRQGEGIGGGGVRLVVVDHHVLLEDADDFALPALGDAELEDAQVLPGVGVIDCGYGTAAVRRHRLEVDPLELEEVADDHGHLLDALGDVERVLLLADDS